MRPFLGGLAFRAMTAGNTQVRRLGYITAITQLLSTSVVPSGALLAHLVEWAQISKAHLEKYGLERDEQGAIANGKSMGPKRYLDVAEALLLAARSGGAVTLSYFGTLLRSLARLEESENPFHLSHSERLFYTYWLLLNDADFLLLVMDAAAAEGSVRLAKLQENFKYLMIERLEAKWPLVSPAMGQEELKEALRRARHEWRRPERYAEHIIPPRANWLLDLGLMHSAKFRQQEYALNESGLTLLSSLDPIPGAPELHDVTGEWLWQKAFTAIESAIGYPRNKTKWEEVPGEEQCKLLEKPLGQACRRFALFGMQACSMLPALMYAAITINVCHQVMVELGQLTDWINKEGPLFGLPYKVHFSPRESEAYISLEA